MADVKGTLKQIWNLPMSLPSYESNTMKISHLKQILLFEICAGEICEKFVYKHSETIEYVKN